MKMLLMPETLTCEQLPIEECHHVTYDAESASKLESYLIGRLQSGDKDAVFPLGQLHFEQVV